jgi:hypothetical protein
MSVDLVRSKCQSDITSPSTWQSTFARWSGTKGEILAAIFEEDQAEHDMPVLGRIHLVALRVGGLPQLRLEAEGRAISRAARCRF